MPKPILYAHNTQTMSTAAKPANVMNMVLTTHFFWTKPPKSTARPGTLISATKVAAVSCQALSPVSSQGWSDELAGAAAACRCTKRWLQKPSLWWIRRTSRPDRPQASPERRGRLFRSRDRYVSAVLRVRWLGASAFQTRPNDAQSAAAPPGAWRPPPDVKTVDHGVAERCHPGRDDVQAQGGYGSRYPVQRPGASGARTSTTVALVAASLSTITTTPGLGSAMSSPGVPGGRAAGQGLRDIEPLFDRRRDVGYDPVPPRVGVFGQVQGRRPPGPCPSSLWTRGLEHADVVQCQRPCYVAEQAGPVWRDYHELALARQHLQARRRPSTGVVPR